MDKLSEARIKEREVQQTRRRDNPHPSPHARQQVRHKSKSSFTLSVQKFQFYDQVNTE